MAFKSHVPRALGQAIAKVTRSSIHADENGILTKFEFDDGKVIRSYVMPLVKISKSNSAILWPMFSKAFEVVGDDPQFSKLKGIFNDDYTDEKVIELLFEKNKFIGFNLFEKVELKKHFIVHWVYAFLEQVYRGNGLMLYLGFRWQYALEKIIKNKNVGEFMCSVDYASYRMVPWPHFPKFQRKNDIQLIKSILNFIFKGSYQLYYDPNSTVCYVIDQLKVRHSIWRDNVSVNEKFYRHDILGYKQNATSAEGLPRSAPMLFFVDSTNTNYMRELSQNLGMSFDEMNDDLAKSVAKIGLFGVSPPEDVDNQLIPASKL